VPVFYDEQLVGYSVTTAHHLDIGALSPGSCGIVDAPDAYAEGLQFNAIKVYEEGRRLDWVWRILDDNIRAAGLVVGDMEAQIAAARIGAARFVELIDKFGLDTVQAAGEDLLDYSERMLRSKIAELPDGTYEATGFVDGFLDHPDPAVSKLRIAVSVTIDGDEIHVDLTGTDPQVDLPINMPFIGTVDIAVYVVLR
jgi:N-methylhydantoinase B